MLILGRSFRLPRLITCACKNVMHLSHEIECPACYNDMTPKLVDWLCNGVPDM